MRRAAKQQRRMNSSTTKKSNTSENVQTAASKSSDGCEAEEQAEVGVDDEDDHPADQPDVSAPYVENEPANKNLRDFQPSSKSVSDTKKSQEQGQIFQCTGHPANEDAAMHQGSTTPEISRPDSRNSSEPDFDVADDDDD